MSKHTGIQQKRYIPILILEKLNKLSYERKDDLYVIIDLIYRRQIYFKSRKQKKYGYVEISRATFQRLISKNNYNFRAAIDFLVDNGIIKHNEYFVRYDKDNPTQKPKAQAYRIPPHYLSKRVAVYIQDKNINKKILKDKEDRKQKRVKRLEFLKTKYHKSMRIDYAGAMAKIQEVCLGELKELCKSIKYEIDDKGLQSIIDCTGDFITHRGMISILCNKNQLESILHRYMINESRVNAINDGFLYFNRNETNNRLDTNLTTLSSFLRPYIISPEPLWNIDIKNSQPFFLYTHLLGVSEIDKDELKQYGEWVTNGIFYKELTRLWIDRYETNREDKQSKKMIMGIFFSKVDSKKHKRAKEFFGEMFPCIMDYINQVNTKNNSVLANLMSCKESKTVIDTLLPKLNKVGIQPYTIHDSILCNESEKDEAYRVFKETLIELYGVAPKFHCEPIAKTEKYDIDEDLAGDENGYDEDYDYGDAPFIFDDLDVSKDLAA